MFKSVNPKQSFPEMEKDEKKENNSNKETFKKLEYLKKELSNDILTFRKKKKNCKERNKKYTELVNNKN